MFTPNQRMAGLVRSESVTATGTLISEGCTLQGIHYNDTSGGTAGTLVFKDGGSSGREVFRINTPGQGAATDVIIPAGGIEFRTDVYVELTNVDGVTGFYQA